MAALPPLPALAPPSVAPTPSEEGGEVVAPIPYLLDAEGNPSTKKDYRIEVVDFRTKTKENIKAMRNLFKIGAQVWAVPEGSKVQIGDETWSRRDVNSQLALIAASMDDMHKHFTASMKVKRTTRKGGAAKPKSLFYISDQLVNYLREANYGNGLASAFAGADDAYVTINGHDAGTLGRLAAAGYDEKKILGALQAAENAQAAKEGRAAETVSREDISGIDVTQALDLVLNKRMATAPILIILLALITAVEKLKSNVNGQRNHYDATMLKYFDGVNPETKQVNNTRWYMARGGRIVDVTPVDVPPTVATKDRGAFAEKLAAVDQSSFARLRVHVSKPKKSTDIVCGAGESRIKRAGLGTICVPCFIAYDEKQHGPSTGNDDWGILHSMYMVITSHFHVPNELLTAEELAALKSVPGVDASGNAVETNPNIIAAAGLQSYIQGLLTLHRNRAEPENKKKRTVKRQQATAANKGKKAPAKRAGGGLPAPSALPPLPIPE